MKNQIFSICIFALLFLIFNLPKAHAQITSLGIATNLPISESKVEDGDIIVESEKGYVLSTAPYDPKIVGVVNLKPAAVLKTEAAQKGFPVITSGIAYVKVTDASGPIKKGDFITTSLIRGTGMKAEGSGFVAGTALDSATFDREGQVKIIQISVNSRNVSSGISFANALLDILNIGKLAASEKPSKVLQYIIAGIITIVTYGAAFIIFAKTVNTGIEAMGRNPLASRMIQLSIIFNVILVVVIIVAGTGLAYLVVRL